MVLVIMKIEFQNPRHEALVNDYGALCKKYNSKEYPEAGDGILVAMDGLKAAPTLYDVPWSPFRPHSLEKERKYKGCFTVDATKIHRIIFRPNHDGDPNFNIRNLNTINSIIIIEIFKNFHPKHAIFS